jgi:hypothetical protein
MTRLLSFALVIALTPLTGYPQPGARRPLFERLAGRWVLEGTIDGQRTVHDVDAEPVLNGGYIKLHEVSREMDAQGRPAYEAIVFISVDAKTGDYACLWLDTTSNRGLSASGVGHARPDGSSIPFVIRSGNGHVFRTTFVYAAESDTWQWRMDDEYGGHIEPFARVTLTRHGA